MPATQRLWLIRHAAPQIDPNVPAAQWRLSDEGQHACAELAERLRGQPINTLIASHEPKAQHTAAILAAHLGLPWRSADGLHEHERDQVGFLAPEQFQAAITALLTRPHEPTFGRETGEQARQRFERAILREHAAQPTNDLAIVAHGTVITLLVAAHQPIDAVAFWRSLRMPDIITLSLPQLRLMP